MFEGVRRGSRLTQKSWAVVRADPALTKLTVSGGVLALVAFIVLGIPGGLLLEGDSTVAVIAGGLLLVVAAFLAAFTVTFFNVALAVAADRVMRGEEPDLAAARGVARGRAGKIASWALVKVAGRVVLAAVRNRGGHTGRLAADVGADIWSLVTFLVVPVVAFEGVGPIPAVQRSARLFRQRWGQQVTGTLVIGGMSTLVVVAGIVAAVGGMVTLIEADGGVSGMVAGGLLVFVGAAVAVGAAVFGGSTRGVFGVALYRYATDDRTIGPFAGAELNSAVRAA